MTSGWHRGIAEFGVEILLATLIAASTLTRGVLSVHTETFDAGSLALQRATIPGRQLTL